jgi:hypothetical protein
VAGWCCSGRNLARKAASAMCRGVGGGHFMISDGEDVSASAGWFGRGGSTGLAGLHVGFERAA